MTKILSYKNKGDNIIVIVSFITAIVVTNSFVIFYPDESNRSYFSNLASSITAGAPLVIALVEYLVSDAFCPIHFSVGCHKYNWQFQGRG
jgi:hypothetical protein